MIAYEFEAEIKEGFIKIPHDFKGCRTGKFKVILMAEEKKRGNLRQALLKAPVWDETDVEKFNQSVKKGYENWNPEEL